jgi:hypothetical protein
MSVKELVQVKVDLLVNQVKLSLKDLKTVAISEAWKILQLAVVEIIQQIEQSGSELKGKDKKALAMELLSKFYDSVFMIIDIPFVPNLIEPIIHRHVKSLLMILLGSTIDAMVTAFRQMGIFEGPVSLIDSSVDSSPKVSDK